MYRTCLHCTRDLGSNDIVESLPIGRRLAFDAAQGRLWVICRSCAKWNLVPFENRLETIEACERFFHDTRTRFSTENIGLARMADGLELIRVGAPQRPEFASWRYGAQYRKRRRVNLAIGGVGTVAVSVSPIVLSSLSPSVSSLSGIVALGLLSSLVPSFAWASVQSRMMRVVTAVPGSVSLRNSI